MWKPVVGFEDLYEVSDSGEVRSLICNGGLRKKPKVLKQYKKPNGYLSVALRKGGKTHHVRVHRLVAMAFLPNYDYLLTVNHIDEDKTNNCVSNLEWVSHQYNTEYSQAKSYTFVKGGVKFDVFNLRKFCREHKLDAGAMIKVFNGKAKHHKGFTKL